MKHVPEDHPILKAIQGVREKRLADDMSPESIKALGTMSMDDRMRRSSRFEAADLAIVECYHAAKKAIANA